MVKLFNALGLACLGLVLLNEQAQSHEFSQCKKVNDLLGVAQVSFVPDPPVAGQNLVVQVSGTSSVELNGGNVNVEVRIFGVTVAKQTLALCQVTQCPVKEGAQFSAKVEQLIPAETPDQLTATVRVSVVSPAGSTVSCLEASVTIANKPSEAAKQGLLGFPAWGLYADEVKFMFERWAAQFHKADVTAKMDVFRDNLIKIANHNADKTVTFTMALNQFADLTADEFKAQYLSGLRPDLPKPRSDALKHELVQLRGSVDLADPPASVDWVAKGAVTPVKNQGACGSCWSFSAVGALESAYFLKTGNLVEFSEQELVSCDGDGTHGGDDFACNGGLMDNAFDWVIHDTDGGLCSEADYPYTSGTTSARGQCRITECQAVSNSKPVGYVDIPPSESSLLAAVATHGPVAVAIEADQAAYQFYHEGVLHGACGTNLNHGVLLVGYGTYEEGSSASAGLPMWHVKNSWGTTWGMDGFVYIQRGKRWPPGGECGIALKASYPVF